MTFSRDPEKTPVDSSKEKREGSSMTQALKFVGFTLLGTAVAVPAILLYLGSRWRQRAEVGEEGQPEVAPEPLGVAPEPIRIPLSEEPEEDSLAEVPSAVPEPEAPPDDAPAVQAMTPTPAATEAQRPSYIASVEGDKFHNPDCRWAKQIQQENRLAFASRAEAIEHGYQPCRSCNP